MTLLYRYWKLTYILGLSCRYNGNVYFRFLEFLHSYEKKNARRYSLTNKMVAKKLCLEKLRKKYYKITNVRKDWRTQKSGVTIAKLTFFLNFSMLISKNRLSCIWNFGNMTRMAEITKGCYKERLNKLCRACLHSFFIDRQSVRELRITRIPRDAVI